MGTESRHYPDWKAPSADGDVLIWPEARQILSDVIDNQRQFNSAKSVRLQNIPLPAVRSRLRQFIGHDDSRPLIATAHQVELHHPGVWVKNAVIDRMAQKVGGRALHLAVDTDAPKHLTLRWPGGAIPLTDDPRLSSAAWNAQLDPPSPVHLEQVRSELDRAAAGWNFTPMTGQVIDSLRRLALESRDLPWTLTNAIHELDWSLGLKYDVLLASPIWASEPFALFAHDLLARADTLAGHYNQALAEYRAAQRIRSSMRPMPDLSTSDEVVEAPFWLDNLVDGTRSRPSLFRSDRGWVLELLKGEQFVFDPATDGWEAAQALQRWLARTQHRLTPRALMLMLFTRIALVDYFVHGIGGGRYDQVTDRLMGLQYGMKPPAFGVATATLYFPGAAERERVCVPCVKREGHRLKHALLGERKRELVAAIDTLPRGSAERSMAFLGMQSELAARARQTGLLERWQEKLHETQAREREEAGLFDRELFFALQPRGRLEGAMERVRMAGPL